MKRSKRLSRKYGQMGGRPKASIPCPFCGSLLGARDMRVHLAHCAKKNAGASTKRYPGK